MDAIGILPAKMRVAFGLKHMNGPKAIETSIYLRQHPAGSPVLVYWTITKRWEGPLTFIGMDSEPAFVQTVRSRTIFACTCVKPYVKSAINEQEGIRKEKEYQGMMGKDTMVSEGE